MATPFSSNRSLRASVAALVSAVALLAATPADALVDTDSGKWTFALHDSQWGTGTTVYWQLPSNYNITWSNLPSFNDLAESYSLCNYTGSANTFTVKLFVNSSYDTLIEATTFTVNNGQCVMYNISQANATSSFKVIW
jgi:hypothetical protein